MRKFWNFILLLVVAVLVIPVFLPSVRHLKQTITINQSVENSFNAVADLNNWGNWFKDIDQDSDFKITVIETGDVPKAKITVHEDDSDGDGNAELVLKKSVKDRLLAFKVMFHHHQKACVKWQFLPKGDSTQVTLSFHRKLCYPFGRLLGAFMDNKLQGFMGTAILSFRDFAEAIPRENEK